MSDFTPRPSREIEDANWLEYCVVLAAIGLSVWAFMLPWRYSAKNQLALTVASGTFVAVSLLMFLGRCLPECSQPFLSIILVAKVISFAFLENFHGGIVGIGIQVFLVVLVTVWARPRPVFFWPFGIFSAAIAMNRWTWFADLESARAGDQIFNTLLLIFGFLILGIIYPLIALAAHHLFPARRCTEGICRQCSYDLRGLTELRCPECGTAFERLIDFDQNDEAIVG